MDVSIDREEAIQAMMEEVEGFYDWDEIRNMMNVDDAENGQFGGQGPIADHVEVVPHGRMASSRYHVVFERFKVTIRDMGAILFEEVVPTMVSILQHVLDSVLVNVAETDLVRLCIDHRSLDIPIWIIAAHKSQLTVDRWMLEVQKVLNSQEEVRFDESFSIIVSYATPPAGSALVNVLRPLQNRLSKSTSVVVIKNKDEICMARAIVVGIARLNGDRVVYKKMQDTRLELQKRTALQLIQNAGLPVRSYSIADIPAFEAVSQPFFSVCDD